MVDKADSWAGMQNRNATNDCRFNCRLNKNCFAAAVDMLTVHHVKQSESDDHDLQTRHCSLVNEDMNCNHRPLR